MVGLADTAEEFISACERALNETAEAKARRLEQYRGVLAKTSWDATATLMIDELEKAAMRQKAGAGVQSAEKMDSAPMVVIGAGPTGLSTAYHLGEDALLLEANDTVGGWCRSLVDNGFTFNWAGHIMFSNDPYVHEMYKMLLGDNVHWQDREAWTSSKSVHTRYPFQGSLYGLPPDVIRECIIGAIESRFGPLKKVPESKPVPAPSANGRSHNINGKPHAIGHAAH